MSNADSYRKRYVLAVALGAIAGGLIVALGTKAVPRMMSQMMSNMASQMRQTMMACLKEEGANPAEM